MRIVLVVLWFGFTVSVLGQSEPNPFDLKYRPPAPKSSPQPVNPKPGTDTSEAKAPVLKQEAPLPDSSFLKGIEDSIGQKPGNNPFELKQQGDLPDTPGTSIDSADIDSTEISPAYLPKPLSKGIQIFFILLSLLFLIFIVNVERNFVRDLWRVISNENYSSLHLRNQRNTMRQILLIMGYAIFVFQAGMFFYHVLTVFHYRGRILENIWACIAFVLVIYLVRHAVIRYLRWLFSNEKEMTLFGFDISIFNIMVGLVLLPLNVLLNFGPESLTKPLIIIGLLIIGVAYLMRQLRWMLTARRLIANSLFLFFVYLCAIEILPLWAISKFLW